MELLVTVLDKFGSAMDPDVDGQKLLEQYQAQYESSIRTSMEAVNNPLLIMAGARLADKVMPAAHHGGCQTGRQGNACCSSWRVPGWQTRLCLLLIMAGARLADKAAHRERAFLSINAQCQSSRACWKDWNELRAVVCSPSNGPEHMNLGKHTSHSLALCPWLKTDSFYS